MESNQINSQLTRDSTQEIQASSLSLTNNFTFEQIKDSIGVKRKYENVHSGVFQNFSSKTDIYKYLKDHMQVSII